MYKSLKFDEVGRVFRTGVGRSQVVTQALENINFIIEPSQVVSIIGPSGCGKSTLLRMAAGFDKPSTGGIFLDGDKVESPGVDRGVVFQSPQLYPWLSVFSNVVIGPKKRGIKRTQYTKDAKRYIEAVGLEGFETHYPHQLSGGMRQRLQIARVLINEPSILLMDEPFGALDYQTRLEMQRLLLDLSLQYRPTVLFITHDVDEAVFISDRIHVMDTGPGRIIDTIDVTLPYPRIYEETSTSEKFARIKFRALSNLKH